MIHARLPGLLMILAAPTSLGSLGFIRSALLAPIINPD